MIGWRPPEYGVDNVRGLFLATYEAGRLAYRGGAGTGFTDKMRRDVWDVLQLIGTDERPPVVGMPRAEMRAARWVEPRLLAEVEYTEITLDGLIRIRLSRACAKTNPPPMFTWRRDPMVDLNHPTNSAPEERLGHLPVNADDIVVMISDVLYEYLPRDSGVSAKEALGEVLAILETPLALEIYEREMERRHPRDASRWH